MANPFAIWLRSFQSGYFLLIENALEGKSWLGLIWFGYYLAEMMPKLAPSLLAEPRCLTGGFPLFYVDMGYIISPF
jgi:hypothetical protein